jgi:hypothetical protein
MFVRMFAAALVVVVLCSQAGADSGSIGGKVGGMPKPPSGKPPAQVEHPQPAGPAIAGSWRWSARCAKSGNWTGSLLLRGSASGFSGSMTQDQAGDGGQIIGGRIQGSSISFKRRFTSRFLGKQVQTWSGTLSGSAISGQIAYVAESCSFTARR